MNKFNLTALSAAFCLAMSTGAIGGVLSKADYSAAKADISANYKSEHAACTAMTGNAKDICVQEAKGHEKVAKAELEARDSPSAKHRYDVRIARADAMRIAGDSSLPAASRAAGSLIQTRAVTLA